MPIPEPDIFTLEEIALRWSKLFGEEISIGYLDRLDESGHLKIESETFYHYPEGTPQPVDSVSRFKLWREGKVRENTIHFVTKNERDRFELEHLGHDLEKLAPKSKQSYLRLIGYMVERLAETDSLDIDHPYVAASQIILVSDNAGKVAGSQNFISTTIGEAKTVWEKSIKCPD